MSFHYRGLECKTRKSRNTWSNRQIWPWSTERRGQRLIEFCHKNALVVANALFQQHRRRLTRGHHQMINTEIRLIILCSQKWKSSIQSAKTRPGADCGTDNELLIAKFRFKLNTVGKPLEYSGMTYIKYLMIMQWK